MNARNFGVMCFPEGHSSRKVLCSVVVYQYAFRWRRVGLPVGALDGRIILIFGAVTVFLATVLEGVFDSGLAGAR